MPALLKAYLAALLVLGVLDGLWLGVFMKGFYRRHIGSQMADPVRWRPALLFYLAYPAALVFLALTPAGQPAGEQVLRAAVVGLVAYGVYDLTNRATLRHWPWRLVLADIAWGTAASTAAGAVAVWTVQRA